MPTLPHSERKSSEVRSFFTVPQESRLEELNHLIESGQGNKAQPIEEMRRELRAARREDRAAKMRERMANRAILPDIPRSELSRPIQLGLAGSTPRLPNIVRAALRVALEILGYDEISPITVRELMTPGRGPRILFHVRRLIAVQLRARNLSLPNIGRLMGGLDHASVHYMLKRCPERERTLALAAIRRSEERQKEENKLREPINVYAWDEWI